MHPLKGSVNFVDLLVNFVDLLVNFVDLLVNFVDLATPRQSKLALT